MPETAFYDALQQNHPGLGLQDVPVGTLDDFFPLDTPSPPLSPPRPSHPQVLALTPNEKSRLLTQLRRHYDEAMVGRTENQERRALRYRRYLADPTLRAGMQPWEDAPQLFLPTTRKAIEDLVGYFSKALLGSPDAIEVRGVGEEDVELAMRRQSFQRWQLLDLNDFVGTLHDALMDAALDSLGIIKVYRYATPYPLPPGLELLQTQVKYEAIDLGTMLIPPDARGLQYPDARYLGQQLWIVPDDEFPGMRQRGFTLPDVRTVPPETYTPDRREELEFTRESIHPTAWQEGKVEMIEGYEVLTMDSGAREFVMAHWFPGLLGMAEATPDDWVGRVTRLQDALPQQVFPRPMWPFFPLTLWPQPRQLRGLNIPDRLEGYQDALNRLAEQMLHLGDITILPLVFANVALTGDLPDLYKMKPGQVVPLDHLGPNGLQIHQPSSANRHFVEQMQVFRSAIEEDSGVTAFSQGRTASQPNAPRTLGGLALLLQQGNEARNQQVQQLARALTDLVKFGYALWQGMPTEGLTFVANPEAMLEHRLYDVEGQRLPLQAVTMQEGDLSGIFDLTIKIDPESHLQQQKYLTLAERLDAVLAPIWPEGRRLLWREIWTRLGLQQFDVFYPEWVAKYQTMLQALGLQVQLAQFEATLAQLQGPAAAQSIQTAQQMAGATSQNQGAAPQSPQGLLPAGQVPSVVAAPHPAFGDLTQALNQAAGIGGGEPLSQAGVAETPSNSFTAGG